LLYALLNGIINIIMAIDTLSKPIADVLASFPDGQFESSLHEAFLQDTQDFFLGIREQPIKLDDTLLWRFSDPNGLSRNIEKQRETGVWKTGLWQDDLTVAHSLGRWASLGFARNRYTFTESYDASIPKRSFVTNTIAKLGLHTGSGNTAVEFSSRFMEWRSPGADRRLGAGDLPEEVLDDLRASAQMLSDTIARLQGQQ